MNGFLLDTNCLSELVRARPEPLVLSWLEAVDEDLCYVSVLTLGEIRKGVALLPQSRRRTQLEGWLEVELNTRFAGRVLPVDAVIADRWGQLTAEAKKRGKTLTVVATLLAATALHHNLTIVSRNLKHFDGTPVPVLNPWEV
jgi:predicted nucleic acid-binding protein